MNPVWQVPQTQAQKTGETVVSTVYYINCYCCCLMGIACAQPILRELQLTRLFPAGTMFAEYHSAVQCCTWCRCNGCESLATPCSAQYRRSPSGTGRYPSMQQTCRYDRQVCCIEDR